MTFSKFFGFEKVSLLVAERVIFKSVSICFDMKKILVDDVTSDKKYRVGVGSFLKKTAVFFKILPPKNDIFEIFWFWKSLLVDGGPSNFQVGLHMFLI